MGHWGLMETCWALTNFANPADQNPQGHQIRALHMVPLPAHDRQGSDWRPSVSTIMSTIRIVMTRAGRVSMIAAGCAGVVSAAVVSAAMVSVTTGKTRTPG